MSIIETIELGTQNFKTLEIEKLKIRMGMILLPRALELEMVNRARDWCKKQEPPIQDMDLVRVQEEAFLLWKSLVNPETPWKEVAEGRLPNVFFPSIDEMQRRLTGDWADWLYEELVKFREEVSPFTSARNVRSLDKVLESIRKENERPEGFLEAFRVVYCTRHGILPTERRVKEMTPDQWWLIWYGLSPNEQMAAMESPLLKQASRVK